MMGQVATCDRCQHRIYRGGPGGVWRHRGTAAQRCHPGKAEGRKPPMALPNLNTIVDEGQLELQLRAAGLDPTEVTP